jgi:hypothetical protein
MVHAADFGRSRDQHARSPAIQIFAQEASESDVTLRRDWAALRPIEGVAGRGRKAITDLANKNFHACVERPASVGHSEPLYEACRTAEGAPIDVLHLEWVVADASTNVIDAGEVRVTGRIRQGRGCT